MANNPEGGPSPREMGLSDKKSDEREDEKENKEETQKQLKRDEGVDSDTVDKLIDRIKKL
jgi:hypothetical protein